MPGFPDILALQFVFGFGGLVVAPPELIEESIAIATLETSTFTIVQTLEETTRVVTLLEQEFER